MLSTLLHPESEVFAVAASATETIFDFGARSGQVALLARALRRAAVRLSQDRADRIRQRRGRADSGQQIAR
jgi:hypothetical protein